MKKVLKIAGGTLLVLLLILILMPFLFRDRIAQEVKNLANRKLKSEMNFSKMSLSFFNHFPSLTLTLTDFSLKSSAPFEKDTLISAGEISFGVNLKSLFGKTTKSPASISRRQRSTSSITKKVRPTTTFMNPRIRRLPKPIRRRRAPS